MYIHMYIHMATIWDYSCTNYNCSGNQPCLSRQDISCQRGEIKGSVL